MGKGKGSFIRWVVRVKLGGKLIETKNISLYRLMNLKLILERRIKLKVAVILNKSKTTNVYFSSTGNYYWSV